MRVFWVLGFLSILYLTFSTGAKALEFVDIFSFLFVPVGTFFLVLTKYGFKESIRFSDDVIKNFIDLNFLVAGIGLLIGNIIMLRNFNFPGLDMLPAAIAINLMPILYAGIFNSFLYVIRPTVRLDRVSYIGLIFMLGSLICFFLSILAFLVVKNESI